MQMVARTVGPLSTTMSEYCRSSKRKNVNKGKAPYLPQETGEEVVAVQVIGRHVAPVPAKDERQGQTVRQAGGQVRPLLVAPQEEVDASQNQVGGPVHLQGRNDATSASMSYQTSEEVHSAEEM